MEYRALTTGAFSEVNQNVLMSALEELGKDSGGIYEYLDSTPKASLVVELTDMLKEFGYDIKPIDI